jgi:hypothetical protein
MLKKVWNDPVWSQVIGAAILAGATALLTTLFHLLAASFSLFPNTPHWVLALCVYGIPVIVILVFAAVIIALRRAPRRNKMLPLTLTITFGVAFIGCAVWYLWPQMPAGKKAVQETPREQAVPKSPASKSTVATDILLAPSPVAAELGMTLEELDRKYRNLDGRFAEQETLVRESNGKKIRWPVEVLSVGNCPPKICLTFLSTAHSQLTVTTAEFAEHFRERLYALRPKDRITLEGVLKTGIYGNTLSVDATGFELVPEAPAAYQSASLSEPQKPAPDLPLGSLPLQKLTMDAVRKSGTERTSMQMIVELRNNNDFLVKFTAQMTNGHINGKKLDQPDIAFDGVMYPKQVSYLRYGRIFDIPVAPKGDPAVPAFSGAVDYDVRYWAAELPNGPRRRTAKRVSFQIWADPGDKPRGSREEWDQNVSVVNEVEE